MNAINFEIVAGTYEEFLLGYIFVEERSELVQSFAAHDHSSSIRSLAVSGHYLASGSTDDRIIVYDLKSRKEHCMLTHHDATVNFLQFTNNNSHLISGSSDGVLSIVRVGNWQLEKVWNKAHKGLAILDAAIHSSGKLALTLGADSTLRTWNLIKGRQAYIINLSNKSRDAKSLDKIAWAEDDVRFILSGGKYTEIWSIETGGILNVIEHDVKVSSCIWFSSKEILVGYENGQLAIIDINKCAKNIMNAHNSRIKALAKCKKWVVSASSCGEIKVWDKKLEAVAKVESGCRITCLDIIPQFIKVKKEKVEKDVCEDQKETIQKQVKSSVIIEVEGSDEESNITSFKTKSRMEKDNYRFVTEEREFSPKIKKSKKRRMDNAFEENFQIKKEDVSVNTNIKPKKKKSKKIKEII